jgi:hypothetical protein
MPLFTQFNRNFSKLPYLAYFLLFLPFSIFCPVLAGVSHSKPEVACPSYLFEPSEAEMASPSLKVTS